MAERSSAGPRYHVRSTALWGKHAKAYVEGMDRAKEGRFKSALSNWFFFCKEELGGLPPPEAVTYAQTLAFREWLATKRGMAGFTVNCYLSAMRTLFDKHMGMPWPHNPFKKPMDKPVTSGPPIGPVTGDPAPMWAYDRPWKEVLRKRGDILVGETSLLPFWAGPQGAWTGDMVAPVPGGSLLDTSTEPGRRFLGGVLQAWQATRSDRTRTRIEILTQALMTAAAGLEWVSWVRHVVDPGNVVREHHPEAVVSWIQDNVALADATGVDGSAVGRAFEAWTVDQSK